MTPQIATVLTILLVTVLLFVSERLRVDLVALLVLGALALSGLVTPSEALSGFSSPAVVTVWAMFILSGALSRTGVANAIGRQVLRLTGQGETRLITVIMITAGVISAFMNNVGVAALLLPVVMDIARRTGHKSAKLLMPLAFGCLLGGLTTLIGTPPNILASNALRDFGLAPFKFFDFAPVGLVVMLAGVGFMALVGHRLIPVRDLKREFRDPGQTNLEEVFDLQENIFSVRLPGASPLVGKSLSASRLGSALGLNVIAILRKGQTHLAPHSDAILQADDLLLVIGRIERLVELGGRQHLLVEQDNLRVDDLISGEISLVEVRLSPDTPLLGQTLQQINFRRRYGGIVLAIWRDNLPIRVDLDNLALRPDDILLVQGNYESLDLLRNTSDFLVSEADPTRIHSLDERLIVVTVPPESTLVGKTLAESRPAETFGLTVLGVIRAGITHLMPDAEERLQAHDTLLVKGRTETVETLHSLHDLKVDPQTPADLRTLESGQVSLAEVVLSPHTTLAGKTLRELHFREKYGLSVLAIWREGRSYRANLRDMALRFGDALLLYGPREKLKVLGSEPDFLVLAEEAQEPPRLTKAPLAILIMVCVIIPVLFGWLPISIAAVIGATLMVFGGSLNMEEAYRFIEWPAVFLIAGMLPLGIAMEKSGAARFLADGVVSLVGELGPLAVMAGLFILTSLASQFMPNPVVTVLMAPIAVNTAGSLGVSPYALMMTVAIAASASFLSPVGHPANVLIMGPGGYRFTDYIRVGLPLTFVVLVTTLLVLPLFWPLSP